MKRFTSSAILRKDDAVTGNADEGAEIEVFLSDGITPAVIFSDFNRTVLSQPFLTNTLAQKNPGQFTFISDGGNYVVVANGNLGDDKTTINLSVPVEAIIENFGGVGNGTFDDLLAAQKACNYLFSIGGGVLLLDPSKSYKFDQYNTSEVNGNILWNTGLSPAISKILFIPKNVTIKGDGGVAKISIVGGSSSPLGFSTSANILAYPGSETVLSVTSVTNSTKTAILPSVSGLSVGQLISLSRKGGVDGGGIPFTPSQERSPNQFLNIKNITGTGPFNVEFEQSFFHDYESAQDLEIQFTDQILEYTRNIYLENIEISAISGDPYVLFSRIIGCGFNNIKFKDEAKFSFGACQEVRSGSIEVESKPMLSSTNTFESTSDVIIKSYTAHGNGNTSSIGGLFISDNCRSFLIEKVYISDYVNTGFCALYGLDISINELEINNCGLQSERDNFNGACTLGFPAKGTYATRDIAESDFYKVRNTGVSKVYIGNIKINGFPPIAVRGHDVDLFINNSDIEFSVTSSDISPFYLGNSGERRSDPTFYPNGGESNYFFQKVNIKSDSALDSAFSGMNGFNGLFRAGESLLSSTSLAGTNSIVVDEPEFFDKNDTIYIVPESSTGNNPLAYTISSISGSTLTLAQNLSENASQGAGVWRFFKYNHKTIENVNCQYLTINKVLAPMINGNVTVYPDLQTGSGPFTGTFDIPIKNFGCWKLTVTTTTKDFAHYEKKEYNVIFDEKNQTFPVNGIVEISDLKVRSNATVDSATISSGVITVTIGNNSQGKSSVTSYSLEPTLQLTYRV